MVCAFFGHRDCPCTEEIENNLARTIQNLIYSGIDEFWVGHQGNFDWLVHHTLKKLKKNNPQIK